MPKQENLNTYQSDKDFFNNTDSPKEYTPKSFLELTGKRTLRRVARFSLLALAIAPGVSIAQDSDSDYAPNPTPQPRALVYNFLQNIGQSDPEVAADASSPRYVDMYTEIQVTNVEPQSISKVTIRRKKGGKDISVALTENDKESALAKISQSGGQRIRHIQIVDNDQFIRTDRTVQLFKVRRWSDWRNSKKRIPISAAVEAPVWAETVVNSTQDPDSIQDVIRDVNSPLQHIDILNLSANSNLDRRRVAAGLIGVLVTERWHEADATTADRKGEIQTMYPLYKSKASFNELQRAKQAIFTSYRESWRNKFLLDPDPKSVNEKTYLKKNKK